MFFVEPNSSIAAYAQLEFQVKSAIASGRLVPHEQLPSIREIAAEVDLNPNTVAKTFRGLETEKFVYTVRGKGIFVAEGAREMSLEYCRTEIRRMSTELHQYARAAGLSIEEL
jgi:GntR family transcriptional regulator